MNKVLIAIAIALLAIPALFASSAEAGHRGHGFHHVFQHLAAIESARRAAEYRRKKAHRVAKHRRAKRKVYVAKEPAAETVSVAKAEETTETAPETAQMQNSSITTVDGEVTQAAKVEADEPAKVAAAEDIGCKQFFPSVGLTLSVPCE